MYIPSIREIKGEIKFALQRAFRGYDDKVSLGWGLEQYFEQIIPSIKEFCEYELNEMSQVEHSTDWTNAYKNTLKLIKDWEDKDYKALDENKELSKLFQYISKHIDWYWN